jgi:tetratricopeptide (TPR) repeat protein
MDGFDIDLPADMAVEEQPQEKSYVPADQLSLANITGESPYLSHLDTDYARDIVGQFLKDVIFGKSGGIGDAASSSTSSQAEEALKIGAAGFNAFIQANVTGPVLDGAAKSDKLFVTAYEQLATETGVQTKQGQRSIDVLRRSCLRSLDVDGVSVYSHIPHIELFCLAKWIFASGQVSFAAVTNDEEVLTRDLAWMRFRIHLWHYKLLSQPSLGPGSLFTKSGRFTDVGTLQELIETSLVEAGQLIFAAGTELSKDAKVQFLLEEANAHIMLGNDQKAKEALGKAAETSGFVFALSGALGKRTKFQQDSTSQLVVFAKSSGHEQNTEKSSANNAPSAVPLNDETLLEKVSFTNDKVEDVTESNLPEALQDLTPQTQPQLKTEDQIILLTEATLKDTFSPADSLTLEEVLPFAERVLEDKSTNWQVYTQALLVRSRIELGRSRTIERGVLQMQAVVDQVIVDTDASNSTAKPEEGSDDADGNGSMPTIKISGEEDESHVNDAPKATTFLPVVKASESASPQVRLRYVNALSSPPRWHLESELAFAWTSVGSLVSALEIFKRLRLWPEVALCLASGTNADDPDGRGSGGEDKARAIVRWRLFNRTGQTSETDDDDKVDSVPDLDSLKARDFEGPERSPPPPNAPRLWCILGDLENNPKHYERAWEISNRRFGRAQKSLGELYLAQKDFEKAAESYRLAVAVNRLSPELWGRLGDIELRLGHFPDATEAYQRAIGASNGEEGGEGARTWSNLGTALLSWYKQIAKENKGLKENKTRDDEDDDDEDGDQKDKSNGGVDAASMPATARAAELNKPAHKLIQDALTAFKRGATIAHANWRIWDNVVTLAASLSPEPALDDVILGTRNVLRIRGSEDALDAEILALLVREATKEAPSTSSEGVYVAPRGSMQNKIIALMENEVVPLITTNSEIWSIVSRLRAWRRDFSGAVNAAEKGWRAALGSTAGSSLEVTTSAAAGRSGNGNWQSGEDKDAWETVVSRTSDLVAAYENWGPRVETIGEQRWKGKARSAVRSVMGKGKEIWEGSEGWSTLQSLMEDLRA